jgi:glycerol uptake facilitator protein
VADSAKAVGGWRAGLAGELLAEFIGTFVLLAFGAGVVAVAVVGLTQSGRTNVVFEGAGGWTLICWGWGLAVTMAVYVAGGVTGAHLNPAVSFAMAIRGVLPWSKLGPYWFAQVAGAFAGAAIVFLDYQPAIAAWNHVHNIVALSDPNPATTFGIFATGPAGYFNGSLVGPFIDQVIGTMFLVLFILGISDAKNIGVQSNLGPFVVGLAVVAIGMSFGTDAGYAINPARDFGPRLFCFLAGYGANAFGPNMYFWVPIIGPLVGGALAVPIYEFSIAKTIEARTAAAEPPAPGRVLDTSAPPVPMPGPSVVGR